MYRRGLSRRQVLYSAMAIGASAALAACVPTPAAPTPEAAGATSEAAPAAAAAEPITLTVWWNNWGEKWNAPMEEFGKTFTAENPSVNFEWTFSDEWREKLLARVAAGDPPDITYSNSSYQANLASQGTFLPLDEYVAQAGIKREDMIVAMWDQCLWEGKLFGLPGGADFIALFYNKGVYKETGLDPETPPKTVSELTEHSLKILKKDDAGNLERIGYSPYNYELSYWGFIFGGEWYDPEQKKVTANHPKNVEALEWLVDYVSNMGADKLTTFQASQPDQWTPGNTFVTGRSAYVLDGYWQGGILDDGAPDLEYGITYFPTLSGTLEERKLYMVGGWMVCLPKGTKYPDQAWQFMKYAFVDNSWKMGCQTVNGCTVIAQMEQFTQCVIDAIGPENRMAPYFHVFGESGMAATKYWPVMKANALYTDELARAYDAAVNSQKTAKQALDELTELVQKELDKG